MSQHFNSFFKKLVLYMWPNYDFCAKVLIEKPFDKKSFSLVAISYAKRIMLENLALHMNEHVAKT